ncbi:conserved hypothetical protein [Verticillium alfalfae VaMs.102]|uniref:Uncharacterized protein n=1 Tax=Verticillium alfalfae (strain VaMs.102 / ATCC MYA-4576 / FGSC 10136) TaxID=526221 RepID=C9SPJ5_VERA1|nr:conserved hypothetical protein [Verticillium alfalfae VaMs.102]EEY20710.1 conserved hypothetical protein [Verticillium alfalfae VaMs.102]
MAPVPIEPEIDYLAVAAVGTHATSVAVLTAYVARSLYRSYTSLSPAQGTRERLTRRSILTPLFTGLAALSLALAGYTTSRYATLSYKVWADQRALEIPARVYGEKGILPYGNNSTHVYVAQWLTDTPVYLDALEIVAEKARRYWWGQQVELATIAWSLLLSAEGRRRNIPFLWAYLALAHLVNLSFAQNLFYLALLLTPTPIISAGEGPPTSALGRLRNRLFPPKPAGWTPSVALLMAALTQSFAIAPASWGTVHAHPRGGYGDLTELFRFVSMATFGLQAKATVLGLIYNAPDAHYHRHSKFLPFDKETRSTLEQTTMAFSKILGSTADHPAVAAAAWDVLLSGVSLGVWAAVRPLDINDILACATPFFKNRVLEADAAVDAVGDTDEPPAVVVRSSGRTTRSSAASLSPAAETPGPKRRGRPRKIKKEANDVADDSAYIPSPTESAAIIAGDQVPQEDLDWEVTALTWGLNALGGLGLGSSGVFGAECISR